MIPLKYTEIKFSKEAEILPCMQQNDGGCLTLSRVKRSVLCSGSDIRADGTNRLNKLIRKAGSVIGCRPDTHEAVAERSVIHRR